MAKRAMKGKGRRRSNRQRMMPRFQLPKEAEIHYQNIGLLQKFITDRGKLISRRISGVTAKQQRQLTIAVKRARFLALLTTGGVKK